MPHFKQLAEGNSPPIWRSLSSLRSFASQPLATNRVTGKGLGPDYQPSGDFTDCTLESAREHARELAKAAHLPIIYLSSGSAQTET
jgi:hypothetical protein